MSHELGHFWAAKYFNVKVEEFGFGLPPRLWGIQKGETLYSVNLLPFGGFVKIEGEDVGQDVAPSARSFGKQGIVARVIILVAGVAFNFILAYLFITAGYMLGAPSAITDAEDHNGDAHITILEVEAKSPAELAGIKAGDIILSLQSGSEMFTAKRVSEVQEFIGKHRGEEITLLLKRNHDNVTIHSTPRLKAPEGSGPLGIAMAKIGLKKYPWHTAIIEGAKDTFFLTKSVAFGIYGFIVDTVSLKGSMAQVSGPVGIAGMVGGAVDLGWLYLLNFIAMLAINLAVLNLIPFPGLDGGRIFFIVWEFIFGKPVPSNVSAIAHTLGFIALLFLLLLITYHDIVKLMS